MSQSGREPQPQEPTANASVSTRLAKARSRAATWRAMPDRGAAWFATLFSGKAMVLWRIVLQNYRRSQLTRMAAALSFRTIFGLIPTLVVGLVVLHAFVSDEQVKSLFTEVLRFTGLDQIAVDEAVVSKAQAQGPLQPSSINVFGFGFAESGLPASAMSSVPSTIAAPVVLPESPAQAARLDEWITTLMARIDGINFGALGLLGAVMLIYAALSMVVETEKCFNQICGATMGKSWMRRIKDYWALLTLGPLLLVASFGVRAGVEGVALKALGESHAIATPTRDQPLPSSHRAGQPSAVGNAQATLPLPAASPVASPAASPAASDAGADPAGQPVRAVLATPQTPSWLSRTAISTTKFVLSVTVSMGMLMVVFAAVPNLRVRVGPTAAGALLAALLWEISKALLGAYIASSMKSGYAALYGAVAIIPLFMLWVYVTWLIVLLGFQVTSTLQQYQSVSKEGFRHGMLVALGLASDQSRAEGLRLVDPAAAVLVLGAVSQRFGAGQSSTAIDVRGATGLDLPVASLLLHMLSRGGWLHRVVLQGELSSEAQHNAPDEERFTLAKNPDEIAATDVLRYAELEGTKQGTGETLPLGDAAIQAKQLATDNLQPSGAPSQPTTVLDVLSLAKHRALANKTIASLRLTGEQPQHSRES